MELNESNNWGDAMLRGGRPKCPKCKAPCEDDGDRYYADNCWECGWSTLHDKERQKRNKQSRDEHIARIKEEKRWKSLEEDAVEAQIASMREEKW
jgi:hypothetical protein